MTTSALISQDSLNSLLSLKTHLYRLRYPVLGEATCECLQSQLPKGLYPQRTYSAG